MLNKHNNNHIILQGRAEAGVQALRVRVELCLMIITIIIMIIIIIIITTVRLMNVTIVAMTNSNY